MSNSKYSETINKTEISKITLLVSHPSHWDILTDILNDLKTSTNERNIIDFDSDRVCFVDLDGNVDVG
tara:strand:+ start:1510 stop:1713 length:204 start_codon:yes stop_codon:yes gene_type:complete